MLRIRGANREKRENKIKEIPVCILHEGLYEETTGIVMVSNTLVLFVGFPSKKTIPGILESEEPD